ncbi:helix-turn-helix domain-containing protein [Aquimarina sediminis]|uniref:helix-turn-helix domain-containing protein n=1 Tax=Aquimarina sediminis TaxID=2070536 RepID=UPI000CA01541|nr:helix-turn-helix transcriptional regulator [Aquimarina sediminis]
MEVLEIILLTLAYTLGIIALFLGVICYTRKIETLETIFFAISLLLLMIAISIANFWEPNTTAVKTHVLVLISMVLVGLTTPLSIFPDRRISVKSVFIKILIGISVLMLLIVVLDYFYKLSGIIEKSVYIYLFLSVACSMILIRKTKPIARTVYREKMERTITIICLVVLPITLFIDSFPEKIFAIDMQDIRIGFTLPLFFIFLFIYKIKDDVNRLSLFKTEKAIKEQNLKNYSFTKRELEVVHLIVKGATYSQIAEELFISIPTVKTHVTNIYKKAKVTNKVELIHLLLN